MKFYRVHQHDSAEGSFGFTWHTSRREALAALRDFDGDASADDEHIDEVDVVPTKAGILSVLKQLASHPDNG